MYVPYLQKPKDFWGAFFHKMTKAHLIRGGGGQGMAFTCVCGYVHMHGLRGHQKQFQQIFPGGAPPDPLYWL